MGRIKQLLIDQPDTDLEDCDLDWQEHQADLMMEAEMATQDNGATPIPTAPMPTTKSVAMTPTNIMVDSCAELVLAMSKLGDAHNHLFGDGIQIDPPPSGPSPELAVSVQINDTRAFIEASANFLTAIAKDMENL